MSIRKDSFTAYLFLLPACLLLGVFVLAPLAQLLWVSLNEWNILKDQMTFVGLKNYRAVLGAASFWQALGNTLLFVAITVPVGMAVSLGLALLLHEKLKGVGLWRTIVFTPYVTSMVAAGIIFIWLLDPDTGLVNAALRAVGIAPINFLQNPKWALASVIVMTLWKQAGYTMMLFLAGLQAIPAIYYEAAAIDGARRGWQTFRHITWPLLWPTTFFVLVISVIFAFRSFEQMFVMTRGGPVGSTTTLVYYIFDQAFKLGNMGQAAAVSALLVVFVLLITWLQFKGQKEAS